MNGDDKKKKKTELFSLCISTKNNNRSRCKNDGSRFIFYTFPFISISKFYVFQLIDLSVKRF